MGYEVALSKAWSELGSLREDKNYSVKFLADEYSIDLKRKSVLSLSCNIPVKEHVSVLMLHYLIRRLKGLPSIDGEWISFKELAGGESYYPIYKKRVIDVIMRKYKEAPDALLDLVERYQGKSIQLADISIVFNIFDRVPLLVSFWRGDEEFHPEVNVLFDKSIIDIFCTEDIVVLSEIVAHSI